MSRGRGGRSTRSEVCAALGHHSKGTSLGAAHSSVSPVLRDIVIPQTEHKTIQSVPGDKGVAAGRGCCRDSRVITAGSCSNLCSVLFDYQPAPPPESSSMKNAGEWLSVRLHKHHPWEGEGRGCSCKGPGQSRQQGAREEPRALGKVLAKRNIPAAAPIRKGWMGWDRHMCMGRDRTTNQGRQRFLHISIYRYLVYIYLYFYLNLYLYFYFNLYPAHLWVKSLWHRSLSQWPQTGQAGCPQGLCDTWEAGTEMSRGTALQLRQKATHTLL